MHPVLFSIGFLRVYSYGFMLAVAFLISNYLASRRSHIFNLPGDYINNLTLILLVSGIIGARVFYVLMNIEYFSKKPLESFMISRGGLVFYGGLLLAFLSGIIFSKINKLSILDTADLIAPFAALGHAIGRIGCFLNGCCYGKETISPLGIKYPGIDAKIYPTQLFSSAGLFIIFLILFYLQPKRKFKGQVLFLYLILYGISRFFIEFLRGDLMPVYYNLTLTQLISIACVIAGLLLYFIGERHERSLRNQQK